MSIAEAHISYSRDEAAHERVLWEPLMLRAAQIEEVFANLQAGDADRNGRREARIAHPRANNAGRGLAPTTAVSLGTLLPGESTTPGRNNTSGVYMVIGGQAEVTEGERVFTVGPTDVWTKPSMALESIANHGDEPFRYLHYSNSALLETLSYYYEDGGPIGTFHGGKEPLEAGSRSKDLTPPIPLDTDGGEILLPYEHLIDPDYVEDRPLHFSWSDVSAHLDRVRSLKSGYTGRPLFVLYNPATGRLNGTTPSFFATIAAFGANFSGPTHRHMSSAINYHFAGSGSSVVNGEEVHWEAGDLMLSAPAWSEHAHTSGPNGAMILTIQDHPFHIGNGSLVWQEDIENGEVIALGTQAGFSTNIGSLQG